MKTILVTGGAGFIGSNLVKYILRNYPDYKGVGLEALITAAPLDNFPPGVRKIFPHFHLGSLWNGINRSYDRGPPLKSPLALRLGQNRSRQISLLLLGYLQDSGRDYQAFQQLWAQSTSGKSNSPFHNLCPSKSASHRA